MISYVSNSINTRVTQNVTVKLFCFYKFIYILTFFVNFIHEYKTLIKLNLSSLDIKIYFHISKKQVMC